jgi:hypothetical protein
MFSTRLTFIISCFLMYLIIGFGCRPLSKALMQAIEHELEVTVRVHEVRAEYERQMEE